MSLYNPNALFSEADLENIKEYLLKLDLTEREIAKLYDCSEATIQRINLGHHYFNSEWQYPIRSEKKSQKGELNHNAYFSTEQILNIYKDLKDSVLSMKDIGKKYNCAESTISAINNGKSYIQDNTEYPIRTKIIKRKTLKNYSEEDIDTIISLLQEGLLTMEEIGKMFNCSRDYISDINNGRKFFKENLTYPLRIRSHK